MNAPPMPTYTSPIAGMFNAAVRYLNRRLRARVAELRFLVDAETELAHAARTAASFADSERSGYIDRTGLEG